jgi:phospho-N-acetylmuramoyl-pentapeptide-transferase
VTLPLAAFFSLLAVGSFVQLAKRYGWGKSIRQAGPKSHLKKEGTPTMAGLAFLFAATLAYLVTAERTPDGLAVLFLTLTVALLGWYDDYLSLRRKRAVAAGESDTTTGLLARYRLALQLLFALGFAVYAVQAGYALFGPAWLDTLFYSVVIVGTVNAVNFSDGLDGLAGGMVVIILLPFLALPLAAALVGALLGFLWYNAKPARTFMGGVGSEGLGAAVAGLAIVSGWVWWLPLIALVPVLEVLSVIVQVVYFRLSGGKRILKMAPLHHHFELSGWPEARIVTRFWLVTAACVGLAWSLGGRP